MCVDLRSKGVDTFTIALALNISEGQVKKMIREGKGKKKKKSVFIKGQ
jgi:hypothetical protein